MRIHQVLSVLPLAALFCLLLFKHESVESKCDNLLNFGRWSSDYEQPNEHLLWQPFDSLIQLYDRTLISKCLSNRTLFLVGDSTAREVFWAVAAKHDREKAEEGSAETGKHVDILYHEGNVTISFIWDPYLNSSLTKEIVGNPMIMHPRDATHPLSRSHVAGIIISTGLWYARYSGREFAVEHRQALDVAAHYTPKKSLRDHAVADAYLAMTPAIILPPPVLNHHWLSPERAETLSPQRLANITENLLSYQEGYGLEVAWTARTMTMNNSAAIRSGGLHVTRELAAYQAEILLNRVCNNILFSGSKKAFSLPCVRQAPRRITLKTGLEVLVLIVITYGLAVAYRYRSNLFQQRSQAVVVMIAIILYCWLADRTTLFDKGNKLVDTRLFCFCTAAVLIISLVHLKPGAQSVDQALPLSKGQDVHRSSKTGLLPREITEEWKGWMQVVILMYHYFGMSKVLPVYQAVRVLVGSYLFLTGYGHTSYFLNTKDFSLRRIIKVVVRLNLLACLLSVVMDNNYEFYYFPSLATIWFLITYAIFWRPSERHTSARELFARILAMLSFCHIVAKKEILVELLLNLLRQARGPDISAREFVFRFQLDILAPFAGMCTAVLESRASACRSIPVYTQLRARVDNRVANLIRLVAALLGVITYTYIATTFNDKVSYNRWHWIISLLPIAAYIDTRRLLWESCNFFAPILVWLGSMSLELFVLQYHIWLAADTKGLLRLGIFDIAQISPKTTTKGSWPYWLETAVATIVFVWTSHCCSRATNILVQWFVEIGDKGVTEERKTLLGRIAIATILMWILKILSDAGQKGHTHQ